MVDAHFDDNYAAIIVMAQCETCSKNFEYELDFSYEHLVRDTNTNELVTCCHDCLNQDY